jgi:hypothetical protein
MPLSRACRGEDESIDTLSSCAALPEFYPQGNRIVIVWDDRTPDITSPIPEILKPIKTIAWSRRSELVPIVDLDSFF